MKLYGDVKHNILQVKLDKRNDVFNWGLDNLFPQLIETLINQSVTSKTCVDKVAKAIYGKSFGELGNVIVNSDGQTLNELLRISAREYAKQNNLFLHIGYNGLLQVKSIKILSSNDVRVGKSDDLGYSGKFVVYNNWNKSDGKVDGKKFKIYDRFNPNKNVIQAQIDKAGSINKYTGQILHLQQDTNVVYSLPDLNSVMNEALLENNSQVFRSNGAEKGFLNTKLMLVQPFNSEEERRQFTNKLNDLQGAENSGNILLVESNNISDDLAKQILLQDLSSTYNDKLFEYSDTQAEANICKAFGVPKVLVNPSDSGLFGNSGELLKEAKKQLFEDREEERDMFENTFQKLMMNFAEPIIGDLKIINPFEEITTTETPTI